MYIWLLLFVTLTLIIVIYARQCISQRYQKIISGASENKNTLNTKMFIDGDETRVFLEYVINNYKNLPNTIIFTNKDREETKTTRIETIEENYYFYSDGGYGYDSDHMNVFPRDELGFRRWFDTYISPYEKTNHQIHVVKGPMTVKREHVINKPKEYYEKIVHSNTNPEVSHYIQRSWYYIFSSSSI